MCRAVLLIANLYAVLCGLIEPSVSQDSAEKKTVTIQGVCVGNDREPLEGVTVRLFRDRDPADPLVELKSIKTTNEGLFYFPDLPLKDGESICRYVVTGTLDGWGSGRRDTNSDGSNSEGELRLVSPGKRVSGRVVDPEGRPVEGATVSHGILKQFTGIMADVTDERGRFEINDIIGNPRSLRVWHARFPFQVAELKEGPDGNELWLQAGSIIEGRVVDAETGVPVAGASVQAHAFDDPRNTYMRSDASGKLRIVVLPDRYRLTARLGERWSDHPDPWFVPAGGTVSGIEVKLQRPGWIEGRVVDEKTGLPRNRTAQGKPLFVTTLRTMSSGAEITEDGRYRLACLPGEYHLFVAAWPLWSGGPVTAMAKGPVITVRGGETTTADLNVRDFAEPLRFQQQQPGVQGLLKARSDSPLTVSELLWLLEQCKEHYTNDSAPLVVRELILRGGGAVPALCEELDRTRDTAKLRWLLFTLRAIGDKRAVPALIRGIPRTFVPPCSSLGLRCRDRELLGFMQSKCQSPDIRSQTYSLGMPLQEVSSALKTLTNGSHGGDEIESAVLQGDAVQCDAKLDKFYASAERWAAWWEANWRSQVDDEAYANVNLPERRRFSTPP